MTNADGRTTTWNHPDGGLQSHGLTGALTPHLLVIEDDPDFRRQIADYFGYLGWTTALAADGDEGVALFQSSGADVVLCDIMLPRMNGFDTIEAIRLLDGGRDVPVVLVSAVWQDPTRFRARLEALGVAEFLRKPLSIVELGRRISVLPSVPAEALQAAATRSGQFRSLIVDQTLTRTGEELTPVGRYRPCDLVDVFAQMFRSRRSGTLMLSDGVIRREITFLDGYPVQAESSAPEEGLASLLVRERAIQVAHVPGLLFSAKMRRVPLARVLLDSGQVSEDQLVAAERARVRAVLRACFEPGPGYYELLDGDEAPVGVVEIHPVRLLSEVVDGLVLGDLTESLAAVRDQLVVPGPEHERLHTELVLPASLHWLGSALAGGLRLEDIIDDAGPQAEATLRTVWLMLRLGIADTVSSDRAPQPGVRLVERRSRPPSLLMKSDQDVRALSDRAQQLLGDYIRLIRAPHHEVLGVPPDAPAEAVDPAWKVRAGEWRALALDDEVPADVRLKARELMARLADARGVLGDPERRATYERAVGISESGPADLTATEELLEARGAARAGRWTDAIVGYRRLLVSQPRALEALLGLAEGLLNHPDVGIAGHADVRGLLDRAAALAPADPRVDRLQRELRRS